MQTHKDGSGRFLEAYSESFDDEGDDMFRIDLPRRHIIPN